MTLVRTQRYVYQQVELTSAQWAESTTVYPTSIWLFEKLPNGDFNMKLSDGIKTFNNLGLIFKDVKVKVKEDTDTSYILVITTGEGDVETPNLRGKNGTVVTIDPATKHLFMDGVDTGVKVEGVDGESAYGLWLKDPANTGKTEADFLAWQQKPATDAAVGATEATAKANDAAALASSSITATVAATKAANDAAKAAEGIVSTIRPDFNVDDKTLSTFVANRPEIPVLTVKVLPTRLTYTNSYGNVVKFRAGDKVIWDKGNGTFAYYTAAKVSATEIEWMQDWGNNAVTNILPENIQKDKYYVLHANENGKSSGVLVETADQTSLLESLYSYGIEKDSANAVATCTRIGNMELHKSLPLQNRMKRCIIKPTTARVDPVVYYLHEDDSRGRDGNPLIMPEFTVNPNVVGTVTVDEYYNNGVSTQIIVTGHNPYDSFLGTIKFGAVGSRMNIVGIMSFNGIAMMQNISFKIGDGEGIEGTEPIIIGSFYADMENPNQTTIPFNFYYTVTEANISLNEKMYITVGSGSGGEFDCTITLNPLSGVAAKLDGTDGDVMVELPEYYIKFEEEGTKQRVKISERFIPGYEYIPKAYVGAFHGAKRNAVIAGGGSSGMWSVINDTPTFRGGDTSAAQVAWDADSRSRLGKPFANNANDCNGLCGNRNAGGITGFSSLTLRTWMTLNWFCTIEYATYNYTLPLNPVKTAEGFSQGGIGLGVANFNSDAITTFYQEGNAWSMPKIGTTVGLGNKTGETIQQCPVAGMIQGGASTYATNSYRGVENMCSDGHVIINGSQIWTKVSGGVLRIRMVKDVREQYITTDYTYPGWENNVKNTVFDHNYGMMPKSTGVQNYTFAKTSFPLWSQEYTPTIARCGGHMMFTNQARGLLSLRCSQNYETKDTLAHARLNYTLPR